VKRIADREYPLGGHRRRIARGRPAPAGEVQRVGPQLIQPKPAKQYEQLIAAPAGEARQRQPLEQPLEPSLRAPARIAVEREPGGRRLGDPAAVSDQRLRAPRAIVAGARSERDLPEVLERPAVLAEGQANAREGCLALEGAEVGGQHARPRGLLEIFIGKRHDLAVQVRRRSGQCLQTPA